MVVNLALTQAVPIHVTVQGMTHVIPTQGHAPMAATLTPDTDFGIKVIGVDQDAKSVGVLRQCSGKNISFPIPNKTTL